MLCVVCAGRSITHRPLRNCRSPYSPAPFHLPPFRGFKATMRPPLYGRCGFLYPCGFLSDLTLLYASSARHLFALVAVLYDRPAICRRNLLDFADHADWLDPSRNLVSVRIKPIQDRQKDPSRTEFSRTLTLMRRTLRRWFAGACACTGLLLLVSLLLSAAQGGFRSVTGLFPAFVLALVLTAFWPRWRRLAKYDRETFDWYQSNHPDRVRQGRVICSKCDSDQVGTQTLRQHSYTRAHFCRTCGSTLFYSPEV